MSVFERVGIVFEMCEFLVLIFDYFDIVFWFGICVIVVIEGVCWRRLW